ncbi:MAG: Nonsense-mediated mRNA decay NMD3 like protein [Thermococci archaeon]|nr:Nonsense-mediated mRNA decay NMD3 like protein [Thermococci archaeon]
MIMRFCYRCGISEEDGGPLIDGLCQVCFVRENPVLKMPDVVETAICGNCGSYVRAGRWVDPQSYDVEDIVREAGEVALSESVRLDERVRKFRIVAPEEIEAADEVPVGEALVSFEFLSRHTDSFPFILSYRVRVKARIHPDQRILHDESRVVEVRVTQTVCPRCQKFLGGYFEAILQVRAEGRKLADDERKRVSRIVERAVDRVMKRDRMGFIQDTIEKEEGLDFYMGSKKAARKVAQSIVNEMGGRISESYELVGMDRQTSREVYRTSVTVRIPEFREGDVISDTGGRVFEVEKVDGSGMQLKSLRDGSSVHMDWKTVRSRELKNVEFEEREAMVTSVQRDEIQLMDMESYETFEMERPPFDVREGEVYRVVKVDGRRYIRSR